METFLKLVAHDLYAKTNGDFAHTAIVFPNKRAGLFFNECLASGTDKPIWSPAYISIGELFRKVSDFQIGDPVKLVCELYKVFVNITGSEESLDDFYFWGELLISDFDDADKNMVDTEAMFRNIKDLNELNDNGYEFLEEGQKEALAQFFRNFSIDKATELKQRFINIWDALGEIYTEFRAVLREQGIAYEGMMYREVTETADIENLPYNKYVFVGFNVLNKVEHSLFSKLSKAGKAMFYWDYDNFYLNKHPHEAGEFIGRNLRDFPSELPPSAFNNLNSPKDITYIESATENGQARYLPQWIRANLTEEEKETAIVLCNETLLQPVLHSLPENIRHINITMGFPLSQTPACSFISSLVELHTLGYNPLNGRFLYAEVLSVLKHPYMRLLSPEAEKLEKHLTHNNCFYPLPSELKKDETTETIFTPCNSNHAICRMISNVLKQVATAYQKKSTTIDFALDQLYREALFKAYTMVNRLGSLMEEENLDVNQSTFRRLLSRIVQSANIPFHGEPAVGIQVMGVLETRNLDFRNIVMLSVNEDQLPKNRNDVSFIPYNIRKTFGMTTIDHKIAVYAYYFYRLLQRAEKVTLLFNTSTDGLNRGEMSRFMLQFLIEWGFDIKRERLEAVQSPQDTEKIEIKKTPEVMKRMQSIFDLRMNEKALLSPSALNTYMDCSLKFYYRYVALLTAPDEVSANIDSAKFGSIFHYAAEHIYKDLTAHGNVIDRNSIEQLLQNEVKLQEYVDNGFRKLFFNIPMTERPEYNGLQLISSAVILRYIKQLLRKDLEYAPFTFTASEKFEMEYIDIKTPKGTIKSRIGGIIDRMDVKDNTLRIVDYKTSGDIQHSTDVKALFIQDKKRAGYIFQTFMYASIVCKRLREERKPLKVSPALLYIHKAASEDYSPVVQMGESRKKVHVDDFNIHENEFRVNLNVLLEEIFNPETSFSQTKVEDKCLYCDYKNLCRK